MYQEKVPIAVVNNMEKIITFVSEHPISTSFAVVTPMVIPAQYHVVIAQLLLQLGIVGVEWIYKKLKIKSKKANYEQSLDDYLNDKNPTEIR